MTDDNNKRLRDKFNALAKEIADTFISFSELRQKAHEIIEVGAQLGMSDNQIKEIVIGLTKGRVSDRTVSRYLGDIGKDQYMRQLAYKSHESRRHFSAEPEIPPPKQEIKEIESQPAPAPETPRPKANIIKIPFDPPMPDRNERSHVFMIEFDISSFKIRGHEMIARRLVMNR